MDRAAILAADVPGYSRLISSDEVDALARAQLRHQSWSGEKRDRGLAKVHGRQVTHKGLADKNGRPGKRYVYFFKPADDRNGRAKHKGNARAAAHSNQLTFWRRKCDPLWSNRLKARGPVND